MGGIAWYLYNQANSASSGGGSNSSGSCTSSCAPSSTGGWTVASVAENAGFNGQDLTTAVAVAYAESSGNPNAYNPETAAGTPKGQGSYGLWQIYLKAHPEYNGQNLFDPQTNANAAYAIYAAAGDTFSPWSTYAAGTGAFTNYLEQAQTQVNSLTSVNA
jgi:hypothetical protein